MDFSALSKMQGMLAQAQQMQEQMDQKLAEATVEGTSGGGMVNVRMNGKKRVLSIRIVPTALGATPQDLELLEDLITAAVNDAGRKADELMQSNVAGMMGGLDLPGLT